MAIAGVNCQTDLIAKASGLMTLAIPHDDYPNPLGAWQAVVPWVALWRCMSPRSQLYRQLPQGAHVVGANEDEEDWPTWYATWLAEVRANRPDLKVHHPAPNTAGQFPYDPALAALCDVVDMHIGIGYDDAGTVQHFPAPAASLYGKPVWVTEVEVDPAAAGTLLPAIPDVMAAYLAAGVPAVFAWGWAPDVPDVLFHPDILSRIAALHQGGTTMGTIEDRVKALEDRDALLTQALHRILTGDYEGASGAAADVVALQGGSDDLTGKIRVPTFP